MNKSNIPTVVRLGRYKNPRALGPVLRRFFPKATTRQILRSEAFGLRQNEEAIQVAVATAKELTGRNKKVKTVEIFDGIKRRGGSLLPAVAGLAFRRQYQDQPEDQDLIIVMEPVPGMKITQWLTKSKSFSSRTFEAPAVFGLWIAKDWLDDTDYLKVPAMGLCDARPSRLWPKDTVFLYRPPSNQ